MAWLRRWIIGLMLLASITATTVDATPIGDSQGKVSAVTTLPLLGGAERIRIYFSSIENDRYGCLANQGFVEVTTASGYVTSTILNRIFALAVTAHATGKSFAIDSPGFNPCSEGNMAWLLP